MTLLSALRAALGASCGPLPHPPITEAATLRRERDALQRACESHRREREAAECANAGLRAERDALADAVRRHKAARQRAGRYVRDLLRELVEARADRDAARATPPAAVARMQVLGVDLAGLRNDLAIARGDRDAAIDRWRVALGERDEARQAIAAMTADRDKSARIIAELQATIARRVQDNADLRRDLAAARVAPTAPAPTPAPTKPLRDYVAEELLRDGWIRDELGLLRRGRSVVCLYQTILTYVPQALAPTQYISYCDAIPASEPFGAAIARAVAAYDAANGGGQ